MTVKYMYLFSSQIKLRFISHTYNNTKANYTLHNITCQCIMKQYTSVIRMELCVVWVWYYTDLTKINPNIKEFYTVCDTALSQHIKCQWCSSMWQVVIAYENTCVMYDIVT